MRRVALRAFLAATVPWNGSRPHRFYVQTSLVVVGAILLVKILENAEARLLVYVIEVAIVFVLGFVVLEGDRTRALISKATRGDLVLAAGASALALSANLGAYASTGFRASPQPGFADAIILLLVLFLAVYGARSIREMIAPISLLLVLGSVTHFISNEDPIFYEFIGRHFVALTVWMSAGLLSGLGYSLITGPDSFRILDPTPLLIHVGVRCGGLDVAVIYTLLIGYFAWQTSLSHRARLVVALAAAAGALILNGLRVVVLTVLFLNYPLDLVEAFHTNVGDFIFLGYALAFIGVLHRFR